MCDVCLNWFVEDAKHQDAAENSEKGVQEDAFDQSLLCGLHPYHEFLLRFNLLYFFGLPILVLYFDDAVRCWLYKVFVSWHRIVNRSVSVKLFVRFWLHHRLNVLLLTVAIVRTEAGTAIIVSHIFN